MSESMRVAAVIVAGGSGLRAGGETPKQYQLIGNKPVITRTLEIFACHPQIDLVQVVIGVGHETLFETAAEGLILLPSVLGGATRQESCRIGIEALAQYDPTHVLIHDAARPFVSPDTVTTIINELSRTDAVIPGLPIADTIKFAPAGVIQKTIDRSSMWFVQTPQGFSYHKIRDAHRRAFAESRDSFTDDAAVAENAGMTVHMISGTQQNRKLTTSHDVNNADKELTEMNFAECPDIRSALGIDFHAFETGESLILCGVHIPYSHKLKGHSDADVALHALTDAILGAQGERDIGHFFPPGDAKWKNADSAIFVKRSMELLKQRRGILANVDLTILAEEPKISKHIDAMKENLSGLLGITSNRIAIKATTTEKMGAIGRAEGMAAFATVTVRLPI